MTLKYFRKLSESKQFRRLLQKGVCIAERTTGEAQLLLFQVDAFYVEVAFDNDTTEVLRVRHFEDGDELQPYLKDIDISNIL